MPELKELDVVYHRGRLGTIVHIYGNKRNCIVEIPAVAEGDEPDLEEAFLRDLTPETPKE
ncbi:MAG: hypothetical protein D4S01_10115 [Dehalococcoidia bacterium]|nr:MAG: hypothetical protein D4S01_10115 [Dehalococcoidia bacterium]